jgi:hypothetical protein
MNRKPEVGRYPEGWGKRVPPHNPFAGGTLKGLLGWRVAAASSALLAISLLMGIVSMLAGFLLLLPAAIVILPFVLRRRHLRGREQRAGSRFPWKPFGFGA